MVRQDSLLSSFRESVGFSSKVKNEDDDEDIKEKYAIKRPSGFCAAPRHLCGYIVNYPLVQRFIFVCIILNCILLGMNATDLVFYKVKFDELYNAKKEYIVAIENMDFIFLVIFSFESGLQLIYHGFALFKEPWLTFDLSLVLMSWVSENITAFENFKVRTFRVLRALRLFAIGPINDLLCAISDVAPRLGVIALLSLLMMYIFCVLFTQLFKADQLEELYFTRLDHTMFTLLQMMTLDFAGPMRELLVIKSWAWIPFVTFLVVMGFLMFNLMAAVICDAIGAIDQNESEEKKLIIQQIEDKKKLFIASSQIKLLVACQRDIEELLQEMADKLMESHEYEMYNQRVQSLVMPPNLIVHEEEKNPDFFEENDTNMNKLSKPKGCYAMERYAVGRIINHQYVQNFILICIIANCIVMGLQATDFNYPENEEYTKAFDTVDRTFLIIFTVESALQVFYRGIFLLRDAWLTFDLFIVIFSWAMENFQVVRGFRVLRAIRVTIRVGPIRDLILALFDVIPKLTAIILLILLMFYIFGVLFTQLFKEDVLEVNYFTRLDYTMLTLIQMMTLDFATPMRELLVEKRHAWIPFLVFVIIMGLLFFNLMAAVICDAIGNLDSDKKEKEMKKTWNTVFRLKVLSFQVRTLKICQQDAIETVEALNGSLKKVLRKSAKKREKRHKQSDLSSHGFELDHIEVSSTTTSNLSANVYNITQKTASSSTSFISQQSSPQRKGAESVGSLETSSIDMSKEEDNVDVIPKLVKNDVFESRENYTRHTHDSTPKVIKTYKNFDVSDSDHNSN